MQYEISFTFDSADLPETFADKKMWYPLALVESETERGFDISCLHASKVNCRPLKGAVSIEFVDTVPVGYGPEAAGVDRASGASGGVGGTAFVLDGHIGGSGGGTVSASCRGSWRLGTACRVCQRCCDEAVQLMPKLLASEATLRSVTTLLSAPTTDSSSTFRLACFEEARGILLSKKA